MAFLLALVGKERAYVHSLHRIHIVVNVLHVLHGKDKRFSGRVDEPDISPKCRGTSAYGEDNRGHITLSLFCRIKKKESERPKRHLREGLK